MVQNSKDSELLARCRQFAEAPKGKGKAQYAFLQECVDSSIPPTPASDALRQRAAFYTQAMRSSLPAGKKQKKKKKKKKRANEVSHITHLLTDERQQLAEAINDDETLDIAVHLLLAEVDPTLHVLSLEDFRAEGKASKPTLPNSVLQEWMTLQREWATRPGTVQDSAFEAVLTPLKQYIVERAPSLSRLTSQVNVDSWVPPLDPVLSMPGRNIQTTWQDYLAIRQKMPKRAAEQMGHAMARLLSSITNKRRLDAQEIPDPDLRQLTNKFFVDEPGHWPAVQKAYAIPWTILLASTHRLVPFDLGKENAKRLAEKRADLETDLLHNVMAGLVRTMFVPKNHSHRAEAYAAVEQRQQRLYASLLCSSVLVERCLP